MACACVVCVWKRVCRLYVCQETDVMSVSLSVSLFVSLSLSLSMSVYLSVFRPLSLSLSLPPSRSGDREPELHDGDRHHGAVPAPQEVRPQEGPHVDLPGTLAPTSPVTSTLGSLLLTPW